MTEDRADGWVGREFEVTVGPVAHGGHCVARHEGRVVFVRHALPGERVVVRVTEDRHAGFCRADAIEVLSPAPGRVAATGRRRARRSAIRGLLRLLGQAAAQVAGCRAGAAAATGSTSTPPRSAGSRPTSSGSSWPGWPTCPRSRSW